MSEEKEDIEKEKEALDNMGVGSTFNLLSESKDKQKKEPEEKKEFIGFK